MSKRKDTIKELSEVLAPMGSGPFSPLGAGPGGSSMAMTSPSSLDLDLVTMVAEEMDLSGVMRDLGTVVGRALADELEQRALKPSDYYQMPELSEKLANRIKNSVANSEEFAIAVAKILKLRG